MTRPSSDPIPTSHTAAACIGRMFILSCLGAGGMGVVYAAYDPELDRKVALKMLRPDRDDTPESRARLLAEAQALARLSHPNVVAVHDVGIDGERVWLAMEFVQGRTVADWLAERRRGWREVVDVFRQAARGVEAAHAAGLLHRDLKPANILIGDDGRVRVADFGLVRSGRDDDPTHGLVTAGHTPLGESLTPTGGMIGTPAYMAPEQFLGLGADERSDQYALCVSLWEALCGERPFTDPSLATRAVTQMSGRRPRPPPHARVPGWLSRVVERGLAPHREHRHASVADLRRALELDPTRRRWAVGFALASCLGVGAWLGNEALAERRQIAACIDEGAAIDSSWNPAVAESTRRNIIATGASFAAATADRTFPWIDAYVDHWRRSRVALCRAGTVERSWDPALVEEARACLDEGRQRLDTLLGLLAAPGDGEEAHGVVQSALLIASGLRLSGCTDPTRLRARPRLPDDEHVRREALRIRQILAEASVRLSAHSLIVALARAEEAQRGADALGWAPLQAAATSVRGSVLYSSGDHAGGQAALAAAHFMAGAAGEDILAANTASKLSSIIGYRDGRTHEGLRWGNTALMFLDRARIAGDDALRAPVLLRNGLVYDQMGDHEKALAWTEEALRIDERVLGRYHPEIAEGLNTLGYMHARVGDNDAAMAMFREALVIQQRVLGPDHPEVATSLRNIGSMLDTRGQSGGAVVYHTQALAIAERTHGPEHPETATYMDNLGSSLSARDPAGAERLQLRGLAIRERTFGAEHYEVGHSHNNLGNTYERMHDYQRAREHYALALSIYERALGPNHLDTSTVLDNLGGTLSELGAYDEGISLHRRSLELLEKHHPGHPDIANPLGGLASAYREQERFPEALAMFERLLAVRLASRPAHDPTVAAAHNGVGVVLREQGDLPGAIAHFERALAIWSLQGPESITRMSRPLTNLGLTLVSQGRHASARPLLERALALRGSGDADPLDLSDTRFALAQALFPDPALRPRALALARAALAVYRDRGRHHARRLARIESWLREHAS